jgi:putative FmdB family regulatory protein
MPTYIYGCKCGQRSEVVHGMTAVVAVSCPDCGAEMHRVPQLTRVNWSGVRFHPSPQMRQFLDETPLRRERYEEMHRDG